MYWGGRSLPEDLDILNVLRIEVRDNGPGISEVRLTQQSRVAQTEQS